jgi:hypothetical protein
MSTSSFQQAFERLLVRAPGPVFPRARRLYFNKYCLEGERAGRFRTFLLQEDIQEAGGGAVRVRGVAFALVHWQAGPASMEEYGAYLRDRWQLNPDDLEAVQGADWFRQGGAYARFTAAAVYERASPTTLVSRSGGPGVPAAGPDPSR